MTGTLLPPADAAAWRRVRRHAVPGWMIERATERREAGDWRGACAAAGVRIAFELRDVAVRHGARVAETLEDDLLHLAPDLLRWHLPRSPGGRTTIRTYMPVLLSGPRTVGDDGVVRAPTGGVPGPWLFVAPLRMVDGAQRLELRFGALGRGDEYRNWTYARLEDWTCARHLWDARRAGELLERRGGNGRAPFLHPDGTPLADEELPTSSGSDPVARTEWITLLRERGEFEAACAEAGIEPRPGPSGQPPPEVTRALLAELPLALARLADEARLTGHDRAGFPVSWRYWAEIDVAGPRPGIRLIPPERADGLAVLPEASRLPSPDLALLRSGRITPAELHPLVRAALCPAATPPAASGETPAPLSFRVRCRGEWHEVGADLSMPHDEAERRRERTLKALGGSVAGCFAVEDAWTAGRGRLPRAARELRRELFLRAQHGDTPGVLRLLDAGVDPRVRNLRGQTLLHLLYPLDHEVLLPRLLEAGLGLETADTLGRTPLYLAVLMQGTEKLVRDLLAAGAQVNAVDADGLSLRWVIRRFRRTELTDIAELVDPAIGHDADVFDEWNDDEGDEKEGE